MKEYCISDLKLKTLRRQIYSWPFSLYLLSKYKVKGFRVVLNSLSAKPLLFLLYFYLWDSFENKFALWVSSKFSIMDPQAINCLAILLLPRHQWPWNTASTDLPPPGYVFFQLGARSYFWSLLDISKPSISALHLLALFLGTRNNNNQPTRSHDPPVMWLIAQLWKQ